VSTGAEPRGELTGQAIAGRYQIMARIGDGGMGVVYRARDARDGTMVAVKLLSAELARDPSWVKRFENEVAAVRQLTHPSTVRLLDSGTTDSGRLYMVMELLSGRSLRDVMDREGALPPERVLRLLMEVCPPLAEAHAKGIFHRDLKPDNLYVSPGDKVKVLDFSVAKLRQPANGLSTAAGVIFGTPQYMAPEQGRGFAVDARADLYSLGMIAFEMLEARVPFPGRDPMEVIARQVREPLPDLPDTPAPVAELVRKLCAKDPAQRFQSADELAAACRTLLRQTVRRVTAPPPLAAPEPTAHVSPAAGGSPSTLFWLACIAGGATAGVIGYLLLSRLA
jgi:serine/threonine-protein kinase